MLSLASLIGIMIACGGVGYAVCALNHDVVAGLDFKIWKIVLGGAIVLTILGFLT